MDISRHVGKIPCMNTVTRLFRQRPTTPGEASGFSPLRRALLPALAVLLFPCTAHANMAAPPAVFLVSMVFFFFFIFFVAVAARAALTGLKKIAGKGKKPEGIAPPEGDEDGRGFFGAYGQDMRNAAIVSILLTGAFYCTERLSMNAFRSKAKASEAKFNLGAIRAAQVAYFTERKTWVGNQGPTPVADRRGNDGKVPWDPDTRFSLIGFGPEGRTYFSYILEGPDYPSEAEGFTALAVGDLDGDGELSIYRITSGSTEITHSGAPF